MTNKKISKLFTGLCVLVISAFLAASISSCGKQGNASPRGLNVKYRILNLSPDLLPVDLFIDFKRVSTGNIILGIDQGYIFGIDRGYFYLPSLDTPYQIRSARNSGVTIFTRSDILKPGAKYTLYIVGTIRDNTIKTIFTVDTGTVSTLGRAGLRFVDASPTATGGLDLNANGTPVFTGIKYAQYSGFKEIPVGNYDLQINATGTSAVIKDVGTITVQDGRLYTVYAYGYTSRADSAAFNAVFITNK